MVDHDQAIIRATILVVAAMVALRPGITLGPAARGMILAGKIVSCPPNEVVPVEFRERLANELSRPNPRSDMQADRIRPDVIEKSVNEWMEGRLCAMYLVRNDEIEMRRIVADNTDQLTQAKAFVEEFKRKRLAARRQDR